MYWNEGRKPLGEVYGLFLKGDNSKVGTEMFAAEEDGKCRS
jgi:hypothetical protein